MSVYRQIDFFFFKWNHLFLFQQIARDLWYSWERFFGQIQILLETMCLLLVVRCRIRFEFFSTLFLIVSNTFAACLCWLAGWDWYGTKDLGDAFICILDAPSEFRLGLVCIEIAQSNKQLFIFRFLTKISIHSNWVCMNGALYNYYWKGNFSMENWILYLLSSFQ